MFFIITASKLTQTLYTNFSKLLPTYICSLKQLRQNLVTWGNAQHDTCAGCGKAEHQLSKTAKAGTSRTCLLCAKFFCGTCKKIFMDKTKKHHTWKCKDDCEGMYKISKSEIQKRIERERVHRVYGKALVVRRCITTLPSLKLVSLYSFDSPFI